MSFNELCYHVYSSKLAWAYRQVRVPWLHASPGAQHCLFFIDVKRLWHESGCEIWYAIVLSPYINKSFNASVYVCVLFIFLIIYFEAGIFARLPCHKPGTRRACKFGSQRHVVASNPHECCATFQLACGCLIWTPIRCFSPLTLFDANLNSAWWIGLAHSQCCNGEMLRKTHN